MERLLTWLPLVCWLAMMAERWIRVVTYRRRGIRVIAGKNRLAVYPRPFELTIVVIFLFWLYLLVAEVVALPLTWLPAFLTRPIVSTIPMRLIGAALVIAGPVLYEIALRHMGDSWRMGIDSKRPGPLVTNGLFAWARNPIYVAFECVFVGTFLVHGRGIYLLLAIVLIVLVHGLILREERFLTDYFGDAYRTYRTRVGRYSPWI